MEHVGIDVHQKYSEVCWLSEEGEVKLRRRLPTTEASLRRFFGRMLPVRVVLESSCVTPWVSRLIGEMGHEVVVLNPRRVRPAPVEVPLIRGRSVKGQSPPGSSQ